MHTNRDEILSKMAGEYFYILLNKKSHSHYVIDGNKKSGFVKRVENTLNGKPFTLRQSYNFGLAWLSSWYIHQINRIIFGYPEFDQYLMV
jgi:hypothetical protein